MKREELIEAIEKADSRDALEALAKKHLETDVDKRRGLESIRMELVEKAEERPPEDSGTNDNAGDGSDPSTSDQGEDRQSAEGGSGTAAPEISTNGGAQEDQAEQADPANKGQAEANATQNVTRDHTGKTGGPSAAHTPTTTQLPRKPKVDPATNGTEHDATVKGDSGQKANRMLTNTRNGRRFVWTAALAKLSHMRED